MCIFLKTKERDANTLNVVLFDSLSMIFSTFIISHLKDNNRSREYLLFCELKLSLLH